MAWRDYVPDGFVVGDEQYPPDTETPSIFDEEIEEQEKLLGDGEYNYLNLAAGQISLLTNEQLISAMAGGM